MKDTNYNLAYDEGREAVIKDVRGALAIADRATRRDDLRSLSHEQLARTLEQVCEALTDIVS